MSDTEAEKALRLALSIISGRRGEFQVSDDELIRLGFVTYDDDGNVEVDNPGSHADILEAAEDIVFDSMKAIGLAVPQPPAAEE